MARQSHLHKGIVALFALLVGTAMMAIPYAVDQYLVPAKTRVTRIDDFDGRGNSMSNPKPTAAPTPPRPSVAPAGPKPTFPANVVTKSDQPVKEKR